MLHTHEVTGSSPVVSTNKKHRRGRCFFIGGARDSNPFNADVRWTSATASAHTGCLHSAIESRSPAPICMRHLRVAFSYWWNRDSNPLYPTVRWTVGVTSANTGHYLTVCHRQTGNRVPWSPSSSENPMVFRAFSPGYPKANEYTDRSDSARPCYKCLSMERLRILRIFCPIL